MLLHLYVPMALDARSMVYVGSFNLLQCVFYLWMVLLGADTWMEGYVCAFPDGGMVELRYAIDPMVWLRTSLPAMDFTVWFRRSSVFRNLWAMHCPPPYLPNGLFNTAVWELVDRDVQHPVQPAFVNLSSGRVAGVEQIVKAMLAESAGTSIEVTRAWADMSLLFYGFSGGHWYGYGGRGG